MFLYFWSKTNKNKIQLEKRRWDINQSQLSLLHTHIHVYRYIHMYAHTHTSINTHTRMIKHYLLHVAQYKYIHDFKKKFPENIYQQYDRKPKISWMTATQTPPKLHPNTTEKSKTSRIIQKIRHRRRSRSQTPKILLQSE